MALDVSLELLNCNGLTDNDFMEMSKDYFWSNNIFNKSCNYNESFAFCLRNSFWYTLDGSKFHANNEGEWWNNKFGERWVIFSHPVSRENFISIVAENKNENAYKLFEKLGIHFVKSGERLLLTGGSFCSTLLFQKDERIVVDKSITLSENNSIMRQDTILKLFREIEFIQESGSNFFPRQLYAKVEKDCRFHVVSEFFHGYTLAEKIFHNSINSGEVINILRSIFSSLKKEFYTRERVHSDLTCQEKNILDRTVRRLSAISNSKDVITSSWDTIIFAKHIKINGKNYDGWPLLYNWIVESNIITFLRESNEMCHGDLIFDDIAVSSKNEWRLLDPNGDAVSKYYDLGKISLSLLSSYELLKYDMFQLEHSTNNPELPCIDFTVSHQTWKVTREIANGIPEIIQSNDFLGSNISGADLLLLNGLHNASLPYFHLIQHRNTKRSLAFFAIAIVRLNQAKQALDSQKSVSLQDAINMCYEEGGIFQDFR